MSEKPINLFCDGCGGLHECICEVEPPRRIRINNALEALRIAILNKDMGASLDAWLVLNELVRTP